MKATGGGDRDGHRQEAQSKPLVGVEKTGPDSPRGGTAGRRMLFIAKVMGCGFITFYSLQDAMPFLVRLTMMAVTLITVGLALRNVDPEQDDEP